MAKKTSGRSAKAKRGSTAGKRGEAGKRASKGTTRKTSGARGQSARSTSNVDRLLAEGALDPDAERALNDDARSNIDALSRGEVDALISAHMKISPRKRWKPDPDGSIF